MDVIPYEPRYAGDFVRLNRAWIERMFGLEGEDLRIFSDVDGKVVSGAAIFLALEDGEVISTCMTEPLGDGSWEVSKLATADGHTWKGAATAVLERCIEHSLARGAEKLVILTNSRLENAIRIYERHGFRCVPVEAGRWGYARVDVQLELLRETALSMAKRGSVPVKDII